MSEPTLFDSMPTSDDVEFFDNTSFVGICIKWSEKGRGFGEYTFSVNKQTGEFHLDNEADGPGTVWRVIELLVDTNPRAIKRMFQQMMCAANVDGKWWSVPIPEPPIGEEP